MAKKEFEHLVKTIPPFKDYGPGFFRQGTEMNGKFFGYDLNVRYGTFYNAGKLDPFRETQVCDYDQVMLWAGTHTFDIGYLGAQIDFCIGEEKERHRITTSTAVSIPKGTPFGPISIESMDERFILMIVSKAPEVKSKPAAVGKPIGPYSKWMMGKYQANFKEAAYLRNGPWHYGPDNPDTHNGLMAPMDATGFAFAMGWESMNKAPYRFSPSPGKPHVHPYTEFLIFLGCDCNDLSEFPAECELFMGGKKMERYLITKPTVAIQPKGHPHLPLNIFKQTKPWIFDLLIPWGHEGLGDPGVPGGPAAAQASQRKASLSKKEVK